MDKQQEKNIFNLWKTQTFALGFFLLLLCSCNKEIELVEIKGKTMGTTYSIKYVPDVSVKPELEKRIEKRLLEINKAVSTYDKDSEISQLNRNNITERKISLSDDLFLPLENAFQTAVKTNGIFDPTIGPLVNLWGFGPEGERKVPTDEEIEKAKARVGYKNLFIDPLDFTVMKKDGTKDIYIDLSATAKGYAVDEIAEHLQLEEGIKNFLVEIGGEIKALGKKGDRPWTIGIETPDPTGSSKFLTEIIHVSNLGMATSGNYKNFFEENGKTYSHTIDYRTGKPVEWLLASVTVLDEMCMNADSLATALMAMGPEKGFELAKKYKIPALFIYSPSGKADGKFETKKTEEFDTYLESAINKKLEQEKKDGNGDS